MIWVAVDAMGGDYAPRHVVDGALAAARHFDLGVALVGPSRALHAELERHGGVDGSRIRLVDAPDVVTMEESPAARRPRCSAPAIPARPSWPLTAPSECCRASIGQRLRPRFRRHSIIRPSCSTWARASNAGRSTCCSTRAWAACTRAWPSGS